MAAWQIGDTIERMTGSPYGVTPGGSWPPPVGAPPPGPPPAPQRQSRAPVIISLVVAFIAIAVAIGSWFRPTADEALPPAPTPQYSEQEVAEATKAVCDAHDLVHRATQYAGNQTSDDATVRGVLTVNVRVGATVSADYLTTTLAMHSATPSDLAEAARGLAVAYQETTLLHLSDAAEAELHAIYARLDAADAKVVEACR